MTTTLLVPPTTPTNPGKPYTYRRKAVELASVVGGLLLVDIFYPLNRPYFWVTCIVVTVAAAGYATYGLLTLAGAAKRWGFVPQWNRERGMMMGMLWALLSILGALTPVAVIKAAVATGYIHMPPIASAAGYLLWCVIQDYVFFALVQRNLRDFINKHVAVLITAVLFGLSHYPFDAFMLASGTVAVVWGYVFLTSRFLWLVTGAHFVLGLMLLG